MDDKKQKHAGKTISACAAWAMLASTLSAAGLLFASMFDVGNALAASAAAALCFVSAFLAFLILREQHDGQASPEVVVAPAQEAHAGDTHPLDADRLGILATSSHEIRTPLNGVIGMINLLLETRLSAEQENYARTAHSSARTLLSIVDETLDTARGHATRNHDAETTRIRPLVEHVTELLAARAHAKGIELSAHVAANVSESVTARDLSLRQILFNLVGNAIKFTEAGGVAVDVFAEAQTLVIRITDTGIGMSADETTRIFVDYTQANAETARRFGGTGLGLGIARRLVSAMGGEIIVASVPRQGSIFTVRIPNAVESERAIPLLPLAGRDIWFASASSISGDHAARMITDLGGNVSRITTAEALRTFLNRSARHSECVIVDSQFARELREWAGTTKSRASQQPHVWVMLTPEDRHRMRDLLKAPFAGYLLKPLRLSTLLSRLAARDAASLKKTAKRLRLAATTPSQKRNILVADDNAINLMLASTMLKKAGYSVTQVSSGAAVIDLLASGKSFDALLLDVEMPGLNGYETATLIRRQEKLGKRKRSLPILALTAHQRAVELDRCLTAGMNGHLTKPFDQHDLAEALSELLQTKAA